jgi:hypothetical protein
MSDTIGVILSVVAGLIGLLGLFVASRAVDTGFSIFGALLALFAVIYIFSAIARTGQKS